MQPNLSSRLATAAAVCLGMLLAGCVSPQAPGSGPASVNRAEQLLRQNNPAEAAQMYEQLAQANPPPDRNEFALAAARAWLAANRADDAQRAIESAASGLTPQQLFERELVRGEVAMARGQYAPAWQQVSKIAAPPRPVDASRLFLLQQQVALRAGQPVEAVRAGLERDRVAASDSDRNRARRDLLNDLRSAIDRGLRVDPAVARDNSVRGWLELGQIAAMAAVSPLSAPAAVERWRVRFPDHPATTIVASEIIALGERDAPRGNAPVASTSPIAVLLPLTAPQSATRSAATLIREGFTTSIARLPDAGRPAVRFYDTTALSVPTALKNARADGAGMIVGPLARDEVQTAVEQRPGDVPLLLLNNLAGSGYVGANLYQYALAPEDEARQIARQMVGQGQRGAMVLTPNSEWGNRVSSAFVEELTRAGGHVVVRSNYELGAADMLNRVKATLGLDEGQERYEKIRRLTGLDLSFEPRPRPEIDAIFAAGYASAQSSINPMLEIAPALYRYAENIPVYMTQDGLDADSDLQANRELLGIYVLDMPWMLETSGPTAALRANAEANGVPRGRQSRYFAFGYDAATLALSIRNDSTAPLAGLTGRITLTPEGRVERNLNWAKVSSGGAIQPVDMAPR